jgi:glycosyltransferase involved in cell wall biosynthesis
MRILYAGPLPPEAGGRLLSGASVHGWDLARQAARRGHAVFYLAPTQARASFVKDGVRVINQPHGKLRKGWDGWRLRLGLEPRKRKAVRPFRGSARTAILGRAFFLRRAVDLLKPDCVHFQAIEHGGPLSHLLQGRLVPAVATDHGYWHFVTSPEDLIRIKSGLGSLKRLVAVSAYARDRAVRDGLDTLVSITVIHNPVDVAAFQIGDPAEVKREWGWGSKRAVLFSGVTESLKIKGLGLVLEAFRRHHELKATSRLVALVDEEGKAYADRFAREHGLDVEARSGLPESTARALYGAAEVCVVPSRSEAFPLVYGESLAAGVPLVGFAPAVGELESLLGISVGEPFDAERETPDDLAEKIMTVLGRSVSRPALRDAVARRLSWDAQFPAYEELYRSSVRPDQVRDSGRTP